MPDELDEEGGVGGLRSQPPLGEPFHENSPPGGGSETVTQTSLPVMVTT